MPTGSSIRLFDVRGIRIGASPSWFVVLFIIIWLLTGRFQALMDGTDGEAFAVAVAGSLLFFGSIVLHELGHAVVAQRNGISVAGVDLWFFGGIAKLSRDSQSPGEEFRIAAAGPAVTLAVFAACLGVGLLTSDDFVDAALLQESAAVSPLAALLAFLVLMNALLFVFNLLPAYPLDGGRIAKAAAWKLTGRRAQAVRIAAGLGQLFGWGLVAWGVYLLVVADEPFDGVWAAALGWLLAQAARGEVVRTAFTERIEGITIADVMDGEPVALPAQTPALEAQETHFLRYGWEWFPVTLADGRFAGVVHGEDVERAVADGRPALPAGELVRPGSDELRVAADDPLEALVGSERLRRLGALFAVDADGRLRGVVTAEQVRRALSAALP